LAGLAGDGLPQYKRIKVELTRMLSSGALAPGEALPTEKQLAARYGVSVGTIRRAVDDLVAEHVLVRQQGRGTYLATFSPDRMLNRFWPVVRRDGVREIPIVQTLSFEKIRAAKEVAVSLAIKPADPAYRIVNVMLMGGNPVLMDEIYIAQGLFPDLTEADFVARESTIYGLYQSRYGIQIVRTVDQLHSVPADLQTARVLGVPMATPLLEVIRIAYTFHDKPVETRRTVLFTERYEYRNAIGDQARM
jgi:GntR family transcriptional regulator